MSSAIIGQTKKLSREQLVIKDNKVVVMFHKESLPGVIREELDLITEKFCKDPKAPFVVLNLGQLNTLIKNKSLSKNFISIGHILDIHLIKWLELRIDGEYTSLTREKVNILLSEYFLYMPMITQRLWGSLRVPFGAGYDKELWSKDYTKGHYAKYRFKEQFKHEFIDKLPFIKIEREDGKQG